MICTKLWTSGTFFPFLCVCVMVFVFVWMIFLCVWFSLPFGKPTKRNGRRRTRWMLCSLCHLMLAKCFSIYMNPGVLVVCNPYCGFNVTATLHSIICIFQLLGKKKKTFSCFHNLEIMMIYHTGFLEESVCTFGPGRL